MAHNTKVNGKMICNMAEVLKLGLMDQNMMVTMLSEESMELEHINGMMDHNILVTGKKIRSQVMEFTHG